MKNTLLFIFALLVISCSKENNAVNSATSQFIGTWETDMFGSLGTSTLIISEDTETTVLLSGGNGRIATVSGNTFSTPEINGTVYTGILTNGVLTFCHEKVNADICGEFNK